MTKEKELTGYPSIDKPWLKYYSKEVIETELPQGNLYEYMYRQTSEIKNKYCLNYFGKRISYKEFYNKIHETAAALTNIGVEEGDVVSICVLTMPESYYLLYAVNMLGAICNYVGVNNSVDEIRKRVLSTESKYVFTIGLVQEKVVKAIGDQKDVKVISVPIYNSMPLALSMFLKAKDKKQDDSNVIVWNEFLQNGKGTSFEIKKGKADAPAIIEYTSGTTGESKGALHPNQTANMIAYNYANVGELMVFKHGDKFLNILPPFYAYGIFVGAHMPICLGVEVYLCPSPDPEEVAKKFKKFKPNHFTGGPAHINAIIDDKTVKKMDLSFLQTVAYGGDGVNEEWTRNVNTFLKEHSAPHEVIAGYGMTEVAGTFCTEMQNLNKMIPFPKNVIRVRNVDTEEDLQYNQEGEIYITGPTLMNGYYANEEMTNEAIQIIDDIRWLKTGDLGFVTEDGELVISGRLKRIYWTISEDGGVYRVYPMKIEQIIDTHENVERSAVVGIKNDDKGYLTFAMLVLHSGEQKEQTIAEVKELCKNSLDSSLQPFKYRVVDSLPMTVAGKVDYKKIEDMLTNQG